MEQTLVLQLIDTGETLFSEKTLLSMVKWSRKTEKRLLRYKRTNDDIKQAILAGNIIVGWANYDEMKKNNREALAEEIARIMRGYEKYFEKRYHPV